MQKRPKYAISIMNHRHWTQKQKIFSNSSYNWFVLVSASANKCLKSDVLVCADTLCLHYFHTVIEHIKASALFSKASLIKANEPMTFVKETAHGAQIPLHFKGL